MSEKNKEQHANIKGEKAAEHNEEKVGAHKHGHRKQDEEKQEEQKKKEYAPEEIKKELEARGEKIKSLEEKILYLQADFENFKRLKAKEKQDTLKFGNEVIIKELLPVIDHLEMALKHAESTEDYKGIHEGVKITLGEFLKVLERAGAKQIEAIGRRFDPNFHEALFQEEREDVEPETVVSELQKGYLLNERLIRPSRVGVSKEPEIQ